MDYRAIFRLSINCTATLFQSRSDIISAKRFTSRDKDQHQFALRHSNFFFVILEGESQQAKFHNKLTGRQCHSFQLIHHKQQVSVEIIDTTLKDRTISQDDEFRNTSHSSIS
jgi:hypothetical protein